MPLLRMDHGAGAGSTDVPTMRPFGVAPMTVDYGDDDVGRCQDCTCPDCMRPLVYFGGKVLCQWCDLTEQGPPPP